MARWADTRFDAEPLNNYIDSIGGVAEMPGLPGMKVLDEETNRYNLVLNDFERLKRKQVADKVAKGKFRGYFTLDAMDEICTKYLMIHPIEIYGDAYFDGIEAEAIEEIAA